MRIACFYDNQPLFIKPILGHWGRKHEVRAQPYYDPSLVEWSDVTFFEWVDRNLQVASREKPRKRLVIARCIDIDAYAKHPGAVDWTWVDKLIFIAEHIRDWVLTWARITPNVEVLTIPCGIELERYTFKERQPGLKIAWIGRLWIGKNLAYALQILKALRHASQRDYHLYVVGDGWHPNWWEFYCKHYIESNRLSNCVHFEGRVPDINEWLEDKHYLLLTSFKESFSYVVGEAAAKGIKPIVNHFWGAENIWPRSWLFSTETEAVEAILSEDYNSEEYRTYIEERYPLEAQLKAFDALLG